MELEITYKQLFMATERDDYLNYDGWYKFLNDAKKGGINAQDITKVEIKSEKFKDIAEALNNILGEYDKYRDNRSKDESKQYKTNIYKEVLECFETRGMMNGGGDFWEKYTGTNHSDIPTFKYNKEKNEWEVNGKTGAFKEGLTQILRYILFVKDTSDPKVKKIEWNTPEAYPDKYDDNVAFTVTVTMNGDGKMENATTEKEKYCEEISYEKIKEIIDENIKINNRQIIFTGAPGTGKTFMVKKYIEANGMNEKADCKFVQFHSAYDYSDFVEGLRPATLNGTDTTFVRLDGIFKAFCRHIVEEDKPDKKYFFIVDEINRADLSKVFGELMFGLEESYRGREHVFATQYQNLKTYKINDDGIAEVMENDCFKDGFYIPENLVIIGMMNDIDRSVETFDFALRRRFQWIEIKANEIMESALKSMWHPVEEGELSQEEKTLIENIKKMNMLLSGEQYARFGLTDAYHIGPAYFKKYDGNNLKEIFDWKVAPIIREYTRGRKEKEVKELLDKCWNILNYEE